MKKLDTKKITAPMSKHSEPISIDWSTPIWALLYLLLMFVLFCKGVMSLVQ